MIRASACVHCGRTIDVVPLGRVDVCDYCGSNPDAASVTAAAEARLASDDHLDGDVADARGLELADAGPSSTPERDGVQAARERRLPNRAREAPVPSTGQESDLGRFGERVEP